MIRFFALPRGLDMCEPEHRKKLTFANVFKMMEMATVISVAVILLVLGLTAAAYTLKGIIIVLAALLR